MNDIYFAVTTKTDALLKCEAKLLRMKKRMLRKSRRQYKDVIPILEQVAHYIYERTSSNPLKQLRAVNGYVYPLDMPVFFVKATSETSNAIYQRERRLRLDLM